MLRNLNAPAIIKQGSGLVIMPRAGGLPPEPPPPAGFRYWGFELTAGGTSGLNRLSLLRWSTNFGTPNQIVTDSSELNWRPTAPATVTNLSNALVNNSNYLEFSKNPSPHLIYYDFQTPRDDIVRMQFRYTTSAYQGSIVRAAKSNDLVNWTYGAAANNAGGGAWLNIIIDAPVP